MMYPKCQSRHRQDIRPALAHTAGVFVGVQTCKPLPRTNLREVLGGLSAPIDHRLTRNSGPITSSGHRPALLRGGAVTLCAQAMKVLIQLGTLVVLARLLPPPPSVSSPWSVHSPRCST